MRTSDDWHEPSRARPALGLDGDQLVLVSAGIDIGSSTMNLVVSRLILERDAGGFDIVDRELAYESPVVLTPYLSGDRIDTAEVESRFHGFYDDAGLSPHAVDTGVVILTGVALNRRNARTLGEMVASWGGHFLSVAAGDHLEGVLAGHGSGAVSRSQASEVVLNVDIGGGTTKLSRCASGRVTHVAAFDIGTRLLAWDRAGTIERLEPSGERLIDHLGLPPVSVGRSFDTAQASVVADRIATGLADALEGRSVQLLEATARTSDFRDVLDGVDSYVLSGGFTEYLAGRVTDDFGDIGGALAGRIRERLLAWEVMHVADPGIRATALGAGQFTVQVSGITIHRAPDTSLPVRNVPVVRLPPLPPHGDLARSVRDELFDRVKLLEIGHGPVAVALPWRGSATADRLRAVSRGLADALGSFVRERAPLLILIDGDVARLLGRHLERELGEGHPLVVVDGIEAEDLDFVDVGEPVGTYDALPITIKSLAFPVSAPVRPTTDVAS
jgi:ethanolamine utilization protein EutA